jgi:hypothetical protein
MAGVAGGTFVIGLAGAKVNEILNVNAPIVVAVKFLHQSPQHSWPNVQPQVLLHHPFKGFFGNGPHSLGVQGLEDVFQIAGFSVPDRPLKHVGQGFRGILQRT